MAQREPQAIKVHPALPEAEALQVIVVGIFNWIEYATQAMTKTVTDNAHPLIAEDPTVHADPTATKASRVWWAPSVARAVFAAGTLRV
jgi:hypothetical protein